MSYQVLAAQSKKLSQKHHANAKAEEDEAWEGSPFDWIRKEASSTKGRIGRDLVTSLLESAGFNPARRGTALEVNAKTIRVKTSLMWGAGDFKFEQFRDSNYDFVFCLGLHPDSAYGWFIPKEELIDEGSMQDRDGLTHQHGGQTGTEDFWLAVNASNVPAWLMPFGGTTDTVLKILQKSL